MISQPDYDFVLQLHCDVLRDVQNRVINASLLTNLALTSPISRVFAQTVPPFQMKAHWAKPELNITQDVVTLSADVAGGARYAIEGINLTMEGQVGAECRPTVVVDDDGHPAVSLVAPSVLDLRLDDLKLTYQGDDELMTWADTTIERTLLRPTLCTQLMAPLANLPLNYLPDAVPLRLTQQPDHLTPPPDGLTLADASISLDPHAESLTLAMRCAPHAATPAPPPTLLSDHTTANAAVALSETGLNRILGWLCAHELATGTTPHADGPVSWRWAHVAATFTDHGIHLTGQLWQGNTATAVDAELHCSLTSAGQLSVHLTTPPPQPANTDILLDAWAHLLGRTFCAATRPPHQTTTEPDSDQPLLQCFVIPGTDLSTKAPTVGLELRHGYLIALYAIPPDEQPFTLTLEQKKPEPTIIQPVIPLQETPDAPVTTQLNATLTNSPQPPYDHAWRADQEPHPRQNHGPTITVTQTPPPTAATGQPQKLTTVNLKVIDILGQLGEAEVDAMYYPAATQEQDQEEHQDGKRQTKAAPDDAGFFASAAQFYRKWKDHHKVATAVLRVTGPIVVAAILVFIGGANFLGGAQSSQGPTPPASPESPSTGPGGTGPGGTGPGGTGPGGTGPGGTGPGGTGPGGTGPGGTGFGGTGPGGTGPGGTGPGGTGPGGTGPGGTGPGGTGSVQIRADGTGIVTSQPGGISCPPTCSADFPTGTAVQLTAAPSTTSVFGGWSGSCTGTNITCQIRIPDAGADIAATFIPKPQLTVTVSEGGSVTGSGISCPPTCRAMVNPGESVTLTAKADSYYNFESWGGDNSNTCTTTTPTCTVVMNGNRTLSANFRSEIAPFIGTWSNVDPNTRSITQVKLTQASPSTATLQVWGSCTPTWCDWGTTTATLSAGKLEAFYDHGFATRKIFISQSNGQLTVQIHTHFTDNSERQDYDSADIMKKT